VITFKNYILENQESRIVNGSLPENLLVPVDNKGNKLVKTVAFAFLQAVNESKKNTGESLQLVGPNSSYRTYQQQIYIAKRYGIGQAAKPGRSRHGFGISVDVIKNNAWKWFVTAGPSFGFYQLNSTNEAHHFDYKRNIPEFNGKQLVYSDGEKYTQDSINSDRVEDPYDENLTTGATEQDTGSPILNALGQVKSGFEMLMPKLQ
jgi:hypothetical protein